MARIGMAIVSCLIMIFLAGGIEVGQAWTDVAVARTPNQKSSVPHLQKPRWDKTFLTNYNSESVVQTEQNLDEPLGSIGDLVWHDTNRNGLYDLGEFGIANVVIALENTTITTMTTAISTTITLTNTTIVTTTTDINGRYLFNELSLDKYTVTVDTATLPDDKLTMATADPDGNADSTAQITLTPREPHDRAQDFGYERDPELATIGQWFWFDENQNGIKDQNEPPVINATINLYDAQGNIIETTITSVYGYFIFLVPAGDYVLEFVKPTGHIFTIEGVEAVDGVVNSDVNRSTGFTEVIHLKRGEHAPNWDAGIIQAPSAITLIDFTVEQSHEDELFIHWTTSAEIATSGFHILRSADGTLAGTRRLTEHMIHSQGTMGGRYEVAFTYNESVEPPLSLLSFWLYEIEVGGRVNYYGPATVNLDSWQLDDVKMDDLKMDDLKMEERLYLPFLTQ